MNNVYDEYDDKLKDNDFLKRHHECLPYIGKKYDENRILIIGESHYVDNWVGKKLSLISDYYEKSIQKLIIENQDDNHEPFEPWINTRTVFTHRNEVEVKPGFFYNISCEVAKVINPSIKTPSQDELKNAFDYFAFVNYFKRPSFKKGKEIKDINDEDKKYAFEITKYIIDVIRPKHIAFISKKSYYLFNENNNNNDLDIKSFSHPSCPWWNRRKKNGKNAKEEFSEFLNSIINKE